MRPCPICCYPIMSLTPARCPGCGSMLRVGTAELEDRLVSRLKSRMEELPYAPEAISFVHRVMEMAVTDPGPSDREPEFRPVSPVDLVWALRDHARTLFGREACAILQDWGVHASDDIGTIVEVLWEEGLVEGDFLAQKDLFRGVYTLPEAFEPDEPPTG